MASSIRGESLHFWRTARISRRDAIAGAALGVAAATPGVRGNKGRVTAAIRPARRVAMPQTKRPCIPS